MMGVPSPSSPSTLENEKMHLAKAEQLWTVFEKGPALVQEANLQEDDTSKLVTNHLVSSIKSSKKLIGPLTYQGIDFTSIFSHMIMDEVDRRLRGNSPTPFNSGLVNQEVDLDSEQRLALGALMEEVVLKQDVMDEVTKRRASWDKVRENESDFQRLLWQDVIAPADNGSFMIFERGVCGYCRPLKEKLSSLSGV